MIDKNSKEDNMSGSNYKKCIRLFYLSVLVSVLLFNISYASTLEETFKKRIPCDEQTLITLKNSNGRIEVSSWENNEVEIIAYKKVEGSKSSAAKLMERIEIEVDQNDNEINIETVVPKGLQGSGGFFSWLFGDNHSSYSVTYEIKVPYQADLDMNTTNGRINVENLSGRLRLHTTNGKIVGENIKGMVRCHTTNGSINFKFDEITDDDEMIFRTTNGSIKLYFPEEYGGYANLKTTNGHIDSDFRMSSRMDKKRKSYKGEFGEGEGSITCKTTNGSIYLLVNE
ncbi:DUF4097 domain-containing protein [Calditrichota bacterium]